MRNLTDNDGSDSSDKNSSDKLVQTNADSVDSFENPSTSNETLEHSSDIRTPARSPGIPPDHSSGGPDTPYNNSRNVSEGSEFSYGPGTPYIPHTRRHSGEQRSFGSSSDSLKKDKMGTPSFDRYPVAASLSSYNISFEKHPLMADDSFSPFGGYPVSVFPINMDEKEGDDYLHNPDPVLDQEMDKRCHKMDARGISSLIAFIALILGAIAVFIIVPALTYSGVTDRIEHPMVAQEVEVLSAYRFPQLNFRQTLVDPDTPSEATTHTARDGSAWNLVFSDEFNLEGRTFYPKDDPFWTAVDLHYAATRDLEWYDPDAAITENGTLVLTLDAFKNHDLYYRSGMVQSWNKLCFTQGYIEISASLPGQGRNPGLWPGLWTMGNLGRPGYLSTTDGIWPYSYDSCDAGITPNQSSTDGISFLPGQRLNMCTCKGEDHPNPGVGRGAPEIDALEGSVDSKLHVGVASQSLQVAPFDIWYIPDYNFIEIHNASVTSMNTYAGGMFQQAISGITMLNNEWYETPSEGSEDDTTVFQTFGFEYLNDDDDGYIQWHVGSDPTFTLHTFALGPNGNVGRRPISKEPMSIIMNLGVSNSWTYIDWPSLTFPSKMRIDYVRIYQPAGQESVTCDPKDFPTYDYIEKHRPAYDNANYTLWTDAGFNRPLNTLMDGCKQ
ncbi:Beta-glucan synthesis-associated protein [Yarrowia sp. C11]|nr:Beta-glucan synthesis-associated protein [Yarrowia sp. E02]KAG5373492.1 Beta-glucan synthesis-associated protein [Yarrowia sp. C11]